MEGESRNVSTEELIPEPRGFQNRVTQFLKLASLMTNRELEWAVGWLHTMLDADLSHSPAIQIREEILRQYYDLRRQGQKKQRVVARWFRALWCERAH